MRKILVIGLLSSSALMAMDRYAGDWYMERLASHEGIGDCEFEVRDFRFRLRAKAEKAQKDAETKVLLAKADVIVHRWRVLQAEQDLRNRVESGCKLKFSPSAQPSYLEPKVDIQIGLFPKESDALQEAKASRAEAQKELDHQQERLAKLKAELRK